MLDEDKLARNDFIGEIKLQLTSVLLTNNRRMRKILEPKSEVTTINYAKLICPLSQSSNCFYFHTFLILCFDKIRSFSVTAFMFATKTRRLSKQKRPELLVKVLRRGWIYWMVRRGDHRRGGAGGLQI